MRARTVAAIAATAILVGAGVFVVWRALAPRPQEAQAIMVPAIGEAEAVFLADGHPIFVVHHQTGQVSVLDAFSTHVPTVYKLVAWCPEARVFTDLYHGSTYDEWGVYRGGPAPTSMIALSWQAASPGALRVTGAVGPAGPRLNRETGLIDWAQCHFTMHRFDPARALTPGQAAALPRGTWALVSGSLDAARQRMCGIGNGCSAPAPVDVPGLGPNQGNDPSFWASDPQLWLALTTGEALAHLTVVRTADQQP